MVWHNTVSVAPSGALPGIGAVINDTTKLGILLAGIAKDVNRSISAVLENANSYGGMFRFHKIFVVENGSSDGTKEFLTEWARERKSGAY